MKHIISNKIYNGHRLYRDYDQYNPLNLPDYTIRLEYKNNTVPSFSKGIGIQVSQSPNVWDLTYSNNDWSSLLYKHKDLIKVIGANTCNVTNMSNMLRMCTSLSEVSLFDTNNVTSMKYMFCYCNAIITIPLYDTSNVTDMSIMFENCSKLKTIPLFDTSKVTNMNYMFHACTSLTYIPLFNTSRVTNVANMCLGCDYVKSGALALYKQVSTQENPPSTFGNCFKNCGRYTQTGAAELSQIPTSWGGTLEE